MKKIINGVEYETFAPNKNSKELGIDTSRKFIVLKGDCIFKEGSIIDIHKDDYTPFPFFKNRDGKIACFYWDDFAYYNEPKEYKFRVGDKVRIKDCVDEISNITKSMISGGDEIFFVKVLWWTKEDLELLEKASGVILEEVEPSVTANIYASTYSNILTGNETLTAETLSKCISHFEQEIKLNKENKFMSIITNAFKSKENKALEHFNLGTTDKLNEQGRNEFTDFIYETGTTDKKEFFKRIVKAHEEDTK